MCPASARFVQMMLASEARLLATCASAVGTIPSPSQTDDAVTVRRHDAMRLVAQADLILCLTDLGWTSGH
jgi:hypothetical protein